MTQETEALLGPAGPDPGPGAGASLHVHLDAMAGMMRDQVTERQARRQVLLAALQQVPIAAPQVPLVSGAGVLDWPDALSAKTGYTWSVRRITATGFTAGTVTMYKNSQFGEILVPWPSAGTFTFGRGEQLLEPGDRMVFVASGITGYVQINGSADCFESWLLPDYLM
jgi:hypothetical protein